MIAYYNSSHVFYSTATVERNSKPNINNRIVTPCLISLAIRQSPYTKDTSPKHW